MAKLTPATLWISTLLVLTAIVLAGFSVANHRPAAAATPPGTSEARAVACLGRIEPENGVARISARSISGQPSIVGELKVKESDAVTAGQLVAVLNSSEQLEATWRAAEARVALARNRLTQIKAGAKSGDLSAQQAEIARLESSLATAQADYRRYQQLTDLVTPADLDLKRTQMETANHLLEQARARLASLAEVRDVDVSVAAAELDAAIADARQAKADLNQAFIRSPVTGHVVQIRAWPGEEVGPAGLMEIAETGRMYVVAEVPQIDLGRLKVGQRAHISGDALAAPMSGVVERIGLKVAKNDVLHVDPMAFSDARVVEAKIRLDDSRQAERLIHAEVTVIITAQGPQTR